LGIPGQGPHGREHRHSINPPHDEVEQNERDITGGVCFERRKGLIAPFGRGDGIAEALDCLFENTALNRVVVGDQDTFGHDAGLATVALKTPQKRLLFGASDTTSPSGASVPKLCRERVNKLFIAVLFW